MVITYSATEGLRLHGDPRPHQRVVKEAGFRWDGRQVCWYVPGGGQLAPGVLDGMAGRLRGLGFEVEVDEGHCRTPN